MHRHIEAVNYIHELLNCSELNMDDMEPETVELIEAIYDWLDEAPLPAFPARYPR
jgi:hypothetical protein